MEWVETTGDSVEEAKERALDELGVDEFDAEIEILEEPKAGIFGRKKGSARIRARVMPKKPRSKQRPRRESSKGRESGGKGRRSNGGGNRENREKGGSRDEKREDSEHRSQRRSRREERVVEKEKRPPREEKIVPMAEQIEIASSFLTGFVDAFGVDAKVTVQEKDDEIVEIAVDGDDLGHLIGPRGQTMTSLQEMVRVVVQRKTGATNGRLILDVSGYRARRKEALSRFVREIAADVVESGTAKVLEPMNPADRKIVHDTVNEIDGVSTASEGEEPRRRVVIQPAS